MQGTQDITTAHVHELLASALQAPPPLKSRRWSRGHSAGGHCSSLEEALQHRQASLDIREAAFGSQSVAVATGHAGVAEAWLLLASHDCKDSADALQRCVLLLQYPLQFPLLMAVQSAHGSNGSSRGGRVCVEGSVCPGRPALVDEAMAAVSGHGATSCGAVDDRCAMTDRWWLQVTTYAGLEYARTLVVLASVLQRQGAAAKSTAFLAAAESVLQGEHMGKALAQMPQGAGRALALVHALETQLMDVRASNNKTVVEKQ